VESTGLAVDQQLLLDDNPSLMGCVGALTEDVLELDDERVEEPEEDNVVHLSPAGKDGGSDGGDDVVFEGVSLQHHQQA
jgi:hypothetical protein